MCLNLRLCKSALAVVGSEHLLQPSEAVLHPVLRAAGNSGIRILHADICRREAMAAPGIDVAFIGNSLFGQCLYETNGVHDRNHIVISGRKDEAGTGLIIHHTAAIRRRGIARLHFISGHGIAKERRIRPLHSHGCRCRCKVSPCRKTKDSYLIRIYIPLFRLVPDDSHRLVVIHKRRGPRTILRHAVTKNEHLISCLQIGKSHRICLPVRAVLIGSSRKNQHGRPLFHIFKLAADRL